MAENNDSQQNVDTNNQPPEEPNGTNEDLEHWKSMSRKNERDAKAALAAKTKAENDLATANSRVAELEAQVAYDTAVREVCAETGLTDSVVRNLKGTTKEDILKSAEAIKASYSAYPPSRDGGEQKPPTTTVESISKIKNPAERIIARAQNIGLYNK